MLSPAYRTQQLHARIQDACRSPPTTHDGCVAVLRDLHRLAAATVEGSVTEQDLPGRMGGAPTRGSAVSMKAVGALAAALELVAAFGVAVPAELGVCPSPAARRDLQALRLPRESLAVLRRAVRGPGGAGPPVSARRRAVLEAGLGCLWAVLSSREAHPVLLQRYLPDALRAAVQLREDPGAAAAPHRGPRTVIKGSKAPEEEAAAAAAAASSSVSVPPAGLALLSRSPPGPVRLAHALLDRLPPPDRARAVFGAVSAASGDVRRHAPAWYGSAVRGLLSRELLHRSEQLTWRDAGGAGEAPGPSSVPWWSAEGGAAALGGGMAALATALLSDAAEKHREAATHRVAAAVMADVPRGGGAVVERWAGLAGTLEDEEQDDDDDAEVSAARCRTRLAPALLVQAVALLDATSRDDVATPERVTLQQRSAVSGAAGACLLEALRVAASGQGAGGGRPPAASPGRSWPAALRSCVVDGWLGPLAALSSPSPSAAASFGAPDLRAAVSSLCRVMKDSPVPPGAAGMLAAAVGRGVCRVAGALRASGRAAAAEEAESLLRGLVGKAPCGWVVEALAGPWPASGRAPVLSPSGDGPLCVVPASEALTGQDAGVGEDGSAASTAEQAVAALGRVLGEETEAEGSAKCGEVSLRLLRHARAARAELRAALERRGETLDSVAASGMSVRPRGEASTMALRERAGRALAACSTLLEHAGPAIAHSPRHAAEVAALLLEDAGAALDGSTGEQPLRGEPSMASSAAEELGSALAGVPVALALLASVLDRPRPEAPTPLQAAVRASVGRCTPGLAAVTDASGPDGTKVMPEAVRETALALRMGAVSFCAWGGARSGAGEGADGTGAGAPGADGPPDPGDELRGRLAEAMSLVRDAHPAMQGAGYRALRDAARARHLRPALRDDPRRVMGLCELSLAGLADEDSFVHLAAVEAAAALADAAPDDVMLPLVRAMARDGPAAGVRTLLATTVGRAARRCGATLPRWAGAVVAAAMRGAVRGPFSGGGGAPPSGTDVLDASEYRAACLACASQLLRTLGDGAASLAAEVVPTAAALLRAEERAAAALPRGGETSAAPVDAGEEAGEAAARRRAEARASASVRRAAVLLLCDVAMSCGDESVRRPWPCMADVAAALATASSSSSDATVRGHAGVGLTRLRARLATEASTPRRRLVVGLNPHLE